MSKEIDLSDTTVDYFIGVLGELAYRSLRGDRISILVRREDGAVTVISPSVVRHLPDVELVTSLVDTWSDTQIEEFLSFLKSKEDEWAT
jgi:hypothetical protein